MACVSGTGKPLGSSTAFTRTFGSLSGGHHGVGPSSWGGAAVIMLSGYALLGGYAIDLSLETNAVSTNDATNL